MKLEIASKSIQQLVPYLPGKPIEELERERGIKDAVKLASNENPIGPSPKALKSIEDNLSKVNRYPDGSSFHLIKKLSLKLGVSEDNVFLGNGSNEIIELLIKTFMGPGKEVISADPVFAMYRKMVLAADGRNVIVPLKNFVHDLEAMAESITARTRIIFINNPNNPTGTIVKRTDFEKFLEIIPDHLIVVVDEAYFEYVTDEEFPNSLFYRNQGKTIVTLRTFSKIYGLAGLRIGYGIASTEIVSYLNRVRQPFNISSLAQAGALGALDDEDHITGSIELNRNELKYLYGELDNLGVEYLPTQANFFLINLRRDCRKVYDALLQEGVIVRSMTAYGLKEYIRLTVGLHSENEKFIKALKKII